MNPLHHRKERLGWAIRVGNEMGNTFHTASKARNPGGGLHVLAQSTLERMQESSFTSQDSRTGVHVRNTDVSAQASGESARRKHFIPSLR
ncbi:hypothetical protein P7K49_030943 [Saguinus oedipus]|uniref:Uncharacterized protein n=1 Tax=Saguinus oedipus TaxID=9490 RepID=A0ABQ9U4I0_SAGOE|nr:hypothetical protein P7K49_030943 [Saguinus oedipus]